MTTGLDDLDRSGMQDIIRTVVRRIEIADSRIEVIFRVPSPDGPPGPHRRPKPVLGNIVQTLVERTSSWFGRNTRIAKDFEASINSARAFLYAASVMLLSRRIARHA